MSLSLAMIGEAAGKISKDCKDIYADIQWRDISGLRNRIVHDYDSLDFDIIYDTIKKFLPALKVQLKDFVTETNTPVDSLLPKKRIQSKRGKKL